MANYTRKEFLGYAMAVGLSLMGCKPGSGTKPPGLGKTTNINQRIGVYDSRMIALAYWTEKVNGAERYRDNKSMGMTPIELGVLMHKQVFSYHEPVQALKQIENKIPEVMKQAGVEVIVSKWDREKLAKYKAKGSGWDNGFVKNNSKVVDITERLVKLYNSSRSMEGFEKTKPAPLDTDWLHTKE